MMNPILHLFRKLRWKIKVLRGTEVEFDVSIHVQNIRLGNEYGGYCVNLEDLNPESIVYSVGIGEDVSFDLDLHERIGCRIFALDPTPKSIEWVESQNLPEEIIVIPWGVSDFDGDADFYPPSNPNYVSHSLIQHDDVRFQGFKTAFRRLVSIMNHFGHNRIDLLKLDIEGGEYAVIRDIKESNIPVNQICLEFHHRFSSLGVEHTIQAVEDLKTIGLYLFRQEENVCSFIRK